MTLTIDPRLLAINTAWQDDKPKRKPNLPKHYKVTETPDYTKLPSSRSLPYADMSRNDGVCKQAWLAGYYCVHFMDQRLSPELHEALARFMTDHHGMRSVL